MNRRAYDVLFQLALPLLIFAAVCYAVDWAVPEKGWWILLKFMTSDGKVAAGALGCLFIFWTGVMLLGSKIPGTIRNVDLPRTLILVGAFIAALGVVLFVVLQFGHPWFMTVFYATIVGLLGSWTLAFLVQGMIDRNVAVRIGRAIVWVPRPRDPSNN